MHTRNDCRLAAQVLRTGEPGPRYEWARRLITSCRDEGPAVLSEQWMVASGDTAELRYLMFYTPRVKDVRLYHALQRVAADPSRSDTIRIAAMIALARYVNPSRVLTLRDLEPPSGSTRRVPLLVTGSTTGWVQVPGSEPIHGRIAPAVLGLFEEIAEAEEARNRMVWFAAASLARAVGTDIELGRAQ
jgi:hypothetical protein